MEKQVKLNQPKGNKVSAEELAQIQQDMKKKELENEIHLRTSTFVNETMYDKCPAEFSLWVRASFMNFSDLILKMPWETYKAIVTITESKYNYQQMDIAIQVLQMNSAEHMKMGINEYIAFKETMQILCGEFIQSLEAEKTRIREEVLAEQN